MYYCLIIFEIKNPSAISGEPAKNQYHTLTPRNNFFRNKKNGGVFFCLPKDEKIKKKWLINIRRENL